MKIPNTVSALALAVLMLGESAMTAGAGPMSGANGHKASGSATIKAGQVELGEDFWFDGGPDVYVAIRSGSEMQLLGKLRQNTGAQSYALPSGVSGSDEILLWCKKYNVTLGKASAR